MYCSPTSLRRKTFGLTVLMFVLVALLVLAVAIVSGCRGVQMNGQYATQLDQTVALSKETAARASKPESEGGLTRDEMAQALNAQAQTWQKFKNARDGVK